MMLRGGACIGALCAALLVSAPVSAGEGSRLAQSHEHGRGAKPAKPKLAKPKSAKPRRDAPPQWGDGSCRPYPVCSSNGCRILPPQC